MKGGARYGAEIIPYEPDPDSAGGGIGFQECGVPFFIWINLLNLYEEGIFFVLNPNDRPCSQSH